MEDALEAFVGVTEYLIDSELRQSVGYAIVYDILASIFDDMTISLKYEKLYDSKTRLKELFDVYGEQLGVLKYIEKKTDMITTSNVYRVVGGRGPQKIQDGNFQMRLWILNRES